MSWPTVMVAPLAGEASVATGPGRVCVAVGVKTTKYSSSPEVRLPPLSANAPAMNRTVTSALPLIGAASVYCQVVAASFTGAPESATAVPLTSTWSSAAASVMVASLSPTPLGSLKTTVMVPTAVCTTAALSGVTKSAVGNTVGLSTLPVSGSVVGKNSKPVTLKVVRRKPVVAEMVNEP